MISMNQALWRPLVYTLGVANTWLSKVNLEFSFERRRLGVWIPFLIALPYSVKMHYSINIHDIL
jgi:hypothetical protein